jgi:hypothetical protein
MSNIHEKTKPFLTHIDGKLRQTILDFAFWALKVDPEFQMDDEVRGQLTEYLNTTPPEEAFIIFSPIDHQDHLDAFIAVYSIAHEFPELLPYLTVIAAKDTWGNFFMRLVARVFLGSVTPFSRKTEDAGKEFDRLLQLPNQKDKRAFVLFSQAGRKEELRHLPADLVYQYPHALILLGKIHNERPTFRKIRKSLKERFQLSEAKIILAKSVQAITERRQLKRKKLGISFEKENMIETHIDQKDLSTKRKMRKPLINHFMERATSLLNGHSEHHSEYLTKSEPTPIQTEISQQQ